MRKNAGSGSALNQCGLQSPNHGPAFPGALAVACWSGIQYSISFRELRFLNLVRKIAVSSMETFAIVDGQC
jgi:hypothetical protein